MLSLRRLSLGTRLTLLGVATLVPIAALAVLSYFEDRDQRRDQATHDVAVYTRSLASNLENFAHDLDSLTVAAALAIGGQLPEISNANNQPYLAALETRDELYTAIFITDLEGRIIAQATGEDTGRDVSSRPYIQALRSGAETVWSGRLSGLETGEVTVAYGRVIRRPGGEPRAYLIVAFYAADLAERVATEIPGEGHLVLIDQDARIVYSSRDPELAEIPVDLRDSAAVQEALAGHEVVLDAYETFFDEDARFGNLVPIESMNWVLGYTRSQSRLDASLASTLGRNLGILGLIGAVSVGALLVVSRQITRPLAALSKAVAGVTANQPLEMPPPTSDPDVSRLQTAFVEMHSAVREREERLADQARVLDTLEQVGAAIASGLDLGESVHAAVDAGTRLSGAAFGAFYYNVGTSKAPRYELYEVSGIDHADFDRLAMPPEATLFGATFRPDAVIRLGDVWRDAGGADGQAPDGRVPVRSYLSLPVVTANGQLLGGLVFGHPEPNVFTDRHERLTVGIAAWTAIAVDNARLYLEAQLVQEELIAANRAKDEFLSLVSHELRTPITIISGGANRLLRRAVDLDEGERLAILEDIVGNSARLSQLVQNLLVLARPGLITQAEQEPMLVRPIVEAQCAAYGERNPRREIRFASQADDAIVFGSQLYLEQVVINLLSNADKYSPAERPVEVTLRAEDGRALVAVADGGPGLSDEDVAHLFEPYYRGSEAQRQASGFGLGLAVCKRLVEAMGGALSYERAPGGGACFIVALPLYEAGEVDEEMQVAEAGAP